VLGLGQVFEGVHEASKGRCIIKILKPVKKRKIKRELLILKVCGGGGGGFVVVVVVVVFFGGSISMFLDRAGRVGER
jgi:hypothetical protein